MVFYNIGLSLYFIFFLRASSHIVIFHSKILQDDVGCIGKTNNKLKRFIKKGKKNKRWHIFKAETQTLRANGDLTHKTHVQLPHQNFHLAFHKEKAYLTRNFANACIFSVLFHFLTASIPLLRIATGRKKTADQELVNFWRITCCSFRLAWKFSNRSTSQQWTFRWFHFSPLL